MRSRLLVSAFILLLGASPMWGRNYMLRPVLGADVLAICGRHGLGVVETIDDTHGTTVTGALYEVSGSDALDPAQVIADVLLDPDVAGFEEDQGVQVPEAQIQGALSQSTSALLDGLGSFSPVTYFGAQVLNVYVSQPATSLIRLNAAQNTFGASGSGIVVAVIDTGIDPNHPALKNSIVPGYDFVHNLAGTPSEFADLTQSTSALLDQSTSALLDGTQIVMLNQSTSALLDQSTSALLDTSQLPHAFGHGTMVAGLVHLVAPAAHIMPLKAFTADGNASLSDIVRAVYYAADNGANVLNMSFSLLIPSNELAQAVNYARSDRGVTSVASTGNTGLPSVGYPAAAPKVIAVASTSNADVRSLFSSYGDPTWVGAPGEGIVTTYPGGHYAAAWGTSFSSPLVAGGVALTMQFKPSASYSNTSKAISQATTLTPDLGYGRLDLYRAVQFAKDKF
jgi:subtilisin family serine protease